MLEAEEKKLEEEKKQEEEAAADPPPRRILPARKRRANPSAPTPDPQAPAGEEPHVFKATTRMSLEEEMSAIIEESKRNTNKTTDLQDSVRDGLEIENAENRWDVTLARLVADSKKANAEKGEWYDLIQKANEQRDEALEKLRKQESENNQLRQLNTELYFERNDPATGLLKKLEDGEADIQDLQQELKEERQRNKAAKKENEALKKDAASLTSELKDTIKSKHQAEADKDDLEGVNHELHERIDALEGEVASYEDVEAENTRMEEEIANVHSTFEDIFTDMAKDLSIPQKLEYLYEQKAAPVTRPRIVSGASLHDELADLSDNDSNHEHSDETPAQTLGFSAIQSVETAPTAAPTKNYTSSETQTGDVTPQIEAKKPFVPTYAEIGTETEPEAPVKPAPEAIKATFADKKVQTEPDAPAEPVPQPTKPVKIRTVYRTIEKSVHVSVTPSWMWVVFLAAILACLAAFAGLYREREIWLDANNPAYQRLMGESQESWMEWFGLGMIDLAPQVGSGAGFGLFG